MSTGPTTLPALGDSGRRARRRLPRLRDARIRSKLALILVVPVAAVIALATVRLVSVGEGAFDATRVRSLTALSIDVCALTQDLQAERMAAAAYLATPQQPADAYNLRVRQTQRRWTTYRAERAGSARCRRPCGTGWPPSTTTWPRLDGTRQEVLDRRQMAVAEAVLRYGVILTDLVAYGDGARPVARRREPGGQPAARSPRSPAPRPPSPRRRRSPSPRCRPASSSSEQFSSFVATLTSQQEALVAFSPGRRPASSGPWSTAPSPATRSAWPTGSPPTSPARSGSARWSPRRTPPRPSAR